MIFPKSSRQRCLIFISLLMAFFPGRGMGTNSTCGGLTNLILVTTQPVSFGNYNATAIDTNGMVTVACAVSLNSILPSFTLALNGGTANSFAPRKMSFLGSTLNYNLYTTGGFSTVWGDGTGSTVTQFYNTNSNVASQPFTVFGVLPGNQFPTPGIYGDSVTVTVTF